MTPPRPAAAPALVAAALLVVYVVWGSTYLAIRVTVEQAPPLLGMGFRYATAGLLLGGLLALRGGVRRLRVSRRELAGCALVGLMLPVLGNGVVALGESRGTPSGVAALLVALTPLMITIYRRLGGDHPQRWTLVGVGLGFLGVLWLVLAGNDQSTGHIPLGSSLIVLFASACWGFGSWIQPRLALPRDAFVMTVHEMWTGGLVLLVLGFAGGERMDLSSYTGRTWLAWAYLVVFGSMVAFTAYVWLLANAPISLVATYAYVNPVVAVFLGALVLSEPVTHAVLFGGAVIVAGVVIVISVERPRRVGVKEKAGIT
ncbi:EamA family transporter [Nocardioides terrisoli]|uniref:EamA family transporter n=1 Tax=Nocardioides terrisoli TaxID=3388267 RepID=UPI00287B8D3A|nr:EamA family transporter [Nocardioides marmorisolisilvae]